MSSSSEITEHINRRRRLASHNAELIARSRHLLAEWEALLQKNAPTIFIGEQRPAPVEEKK
jgi:hypothetical protein